MIHNSNHIFSYFLLVETRKKSQKSRHNYKIPHVIHSSNHIFSYFLLVETRKKSQKPRHNYKIPHVIHNSNHIRSYFLLVETRKKSQKSRHNNKILHVIHSSNHMENFVVMLRLLSATFCALFYCKSLRNLSVFQLFNCDRFLWIMLFIDRDGSTNSVEIFDFSQSLSYLN